MKIPVGHEDNICKFCRNVVCSACHTKLGRKKICRGCITSRFSQNKCNVILNMIRRESIFANGTTCLLAYKILREKLEKNVTLYSSTEFIVQHSFFHHKYKDVYNQLFQQQSAADYGPDK